MMHDDDDNTAADDNFGAGEVALIIPDDDLEFVVVRDRTVAAAQCADPCQLEGDGATAHAQDASLDSEEQETVALPPTKLQKLVNKCCIQLVAYNPLPALCRAIQDSHSPLESDVVRRKQQLRSVWDVSPRASGAHIGYGADPEKPWDVVGLPIPADATSARWRDDLVVKNLSGTIQRAFRQSVLRMLLLVKCGIAVAVCMAVTALPLDAWYKQSDEAGSPLPHVMLVASAALYLLTLGLLYGVRHDTSINSAVVGFLLCVEACVALLACVAGSEHVIITGFALYGVAMASVYALATYRTKLKASGDFELLHPVSAAALSTILVLCATSALYRSSVLPAMSSTMISSTALAGVLACVTLAALWTGLVLHCMSESLAPDEYARCLVLYHSDAVVACCVVPWRVGVRVWRASVRRVCTAAVAASVVRAAAAAATDADPTLGSSQLRGAEDPVEDAQQRFKDHGAYRPAIVAAPADGASRRRSSIAEEV